MGTGRHGEVPTGRQEVLRDHTETWNMNPVDYIEHVLERDGIAVLNCPDDQCSKIQHLQSHR
jgi:hypothetical protein